jgi:hypothetical protein
VHRQYFALPLQEIVVLRGEAVVFVVTHCSVPPPPSYTILADRRTASRTVEGGSPASAFASATGRPPEGGPSVTLPRVGSLQGATQGTTSTCLPPRRCAAGGPEPSAAPPAPTDGRLLTRRLVRVAAADRCTRARRPPNHATLVCHHGLRALIGERRRGREDESQRPRKSCPRWRRTMTCRRIGAISTGMRSARRSTRGRKRRKRRPKLDVKGEVAGRRQEQER